jgi:hypothetical protein
VGSVAELRHRSSAKALDAIAVRAGLFGRRILSVPVGEIEEISPTEGASSALGTATHGDRPQARSASAAATPKNGRSEVEIWPDRFAP